MSAAERTILVVDDQPAQRRLLRDFVESIGFRAAEAGSGEEALEHVRRRRPDMVLLDVRLPGMSGLEALAEIRRIDGQLPVLLITAHADLRQAVAAIKSGADDYLAKPVDLEELEAAIRDALGPSAARGPGEPSGSPPLPALPEDFICQSPEMRRLLQHVAVVAPSDVPVLILGESGTGKERIAQLIHAWSPRAAGPMVAANCAGLPETLIESELFGHTRGAYTGAEIARHGVFRSADGGTLLLDEIGEMPLHLQAKLLRVLESASITPLGSDTPRSVDVRVVAATNRDLGRAVAEGKFREDLYYRLNVVELVAPPLRRRREDILPMARRFAAELAGGPVRLSPGAADCLLAYAWPGNVRQLRNAIQRACLLSRGDVVLPEHLPPYVASAAATATGAPSNGAASIGAPPPPESEAPENDRLQRVERAVILATLEECGGNRTQAAKRLGISRRALLYKLRAIESERSGEP